MSRNDITCRVICNINFHVPISKFSHSRSKQTFRQLILAICARRATELLYYSYRVELQIWSYSLKYLKYFYLLVFVWNVEFLKFWKSISHSLGRLRYRCRRNLFFPGEVIFRFSVFSKRIRGNACFRYRGQWFTRNDKSRSVIFGSHKYIYIYIYPVYTIANLLHCISLLVTVSEAIGAIVWRYMAVSSSVGVTGDSQTQGNC